MLDLMRSMIEAQGYRACNKDCAHAKEVEAEES